MAFVFVVSGYSFRKSKLNCPSMIGKVCIDRVRVQTGKNTNPIVGNDEFKLPRPQAESDVSCFNSLTVVNNIGP